MNKVSLLAASVAIALAGCGGSDGGSNNNAGGSKGLVVTGFDGYFKNAVVFLDKDNNGILDSTDTVFGLTNEKGQITLPENTDLSTGNIALKTLKPGDVVKLGLGDRIAAATDKVDFASDYSDTYTTDMDLPGQPMEHTIVFRSLQDGDNIVISPITDLVALQPAVVYSTDKTAEEKVCDSLFGEGEVTGEACTNKLYSDFTKSDPELHKTAQILTDTKAKSADKYNAVSALSAAKVAVESISKLSEEELADPTVRTTIEITTAGATDTPPEFTTAKSLVTAAKYDEIQNAFDRLDIKITKEPAPSKGTLLGTINVANLFTMHNGEVAGLDKERVSVFYASSLNDNTFYGRINDKNELELYVVPNETIEKVGNVNVTLSAEDGSTVAFSFSVDAAEDAVAPTVDTAAVADLKAEIADLTFVAGQQFNLEDGVILSAESIFDETVKTIELSSNANSIGLTITLSEDQNNILISGRPAHLATEGAYSIQLKATSESGLSSDVITLPLPAIVEAIAVEEVEVKQLQDKINTLSLQVGKPISHEGLDLDIEPLFTQNVSGDLEFYAGLEYKVKNDHEYFTTIPGVRVHTDEANNSGKLTISGTPEEATKDGYFYVAAGINGDKPDEIISKMVKITLPAVQPADEVIPPKPDSFEDTLHYLSPIESLHNDQDEYLGTGVVCEVRYFDSETQNLYAYKRTLDNYSKCPTFTSDVKPSTDERFENYGSYTIDNNGQFVLELEEDGGKILVEYRVEPYNDYFVVHGKETFTRTDDAGKPVTKVSKQLYPAYLDGSEINQILSQWTTDGIEDDIWAEGQIHYINSDNQIAQMKVDAAMNSVDQSCTEHCDWGSMDADIFFPMSCEDVKSIYDFSVERVKDSNNPLFMSEVDFYPNGSECGVDFSNDTSIPLGIHSLLGEVKTEYQGKYQDVAFSFLKD